MHYNLFNHVDIDPKNIHIPDGTVPKDQIDAFCDNYEEQICQAGGLDVQILGIGGTGDFSIPIENL
jgi:glucosamine-6-phosphate deaminase